jgi:hypothetical protein
MNLDSSRYKKSFLGKSGPWAGDGETFQPPFLATSDLPKIENEKILREDYA